MLPSTHTTTLTRRGALSGALAVVIPFPRERNRVAYPAIDITAPDNDVEVLCPRCTRLTVQISNQPVYITFGHGLGMPIYDEPEPYLPTVGQLNRSFDAFKIRAKIPAASLPAGASQAHVYLTPIADAQ